MALQPQRSQLAQLPFEKLLKNNDLGIIENPLRRIDDDELERDIKTFHDTANYRGLRLKDVVGVDVLIRGTQLAKDEEGFRAEENLSDPEAKARALEKTSNIWQESKELKIILLTCFVASIVQGWAQGAIVGANQSWPNDLGLNTGLTFSTKEQGNTRDIWRFVILPDHIVPFLQSCWVFEMYLGSSHRSNFPATSFWESNADFEVVKVRSNQCHCLLFSQYPWRLFV